MKRTSMRLGLFSLFAILLTACQQHTGIPLSLAFPAQGSVMNTQLGLILQKTDILKDAGFLAKVTGLGTGRELKVALVSGQADVILTSQTNFVVLLGEGYDARALGSLGSAGRYGLIVKNGRVNSLNDLKGKTIATIFGTSIHQPAMEWADAAGAKVVNIGSIAAMASALEAGAVDAIVSWDPYLTGSLDRQSAKLLKDDHFDLITVASNAYLAKHNEAAAKLKVALAKAVDYLRVHREEINREFGQMAKVGINVIDKASQSNQNYSAPPGSPVQQGISKKLRTKLNQEAEFLFHEKVIQSKPEIDSHIWGI